MSENPNKKDVKESGCCDGGWPYYNPWDSGPWGPGPGPWRSGPGPWKYGPGPWGPGPGPWGPRPPRRPGWGPGPWWR